MCRSRRHGVWQKEEIGYPVYLCNTTTDMAKQCSTTTDDIAKYEDYKYDKVEGLSVLSGQLTETLMEKYEYRFDKPRVGFDSLESFVKDRIAKMIIIALNVGTKHNLDMIKEFNDMCDNALEFIASKVEQ